MDNFDAAVWLSKVRSCGGVVLLSVDGRTMTASHLTSAELSTLRAHPGPVAAVLASERTPKGIDASARGEDPDPALDPREPSGVGRQAVGAAEVSPRDRREPLAAALYEDAGLFQMNGRWTCAEGDDVADLIRSGEISFAVAKERRDFSIAQSEQIARSGGFRRWLP